jgi:hypothetical protein
MQIGPHLSKWERSGRDSRGMIGVMQNEKIPVT